MSDVMIGDARELASTLMPKSIQCVFTSPPYWNLRDYDTPNQIGNEHTPTDYVNTLLNVMARIKPALTPTGVVLLNLGDSFASAWSCNRPNKVGEKSFRDGSRAGGMRTNRLVEGLKEKDLVGIPWRVAFAMRDAGWVLRSEIVWYKRNTTPEGKVRDRPHRKHEHIFLFSTHKRYQFDHRGHGTVWDIVCRPNESSHPAAFPEELARRVIECSTNEGDVVLDPFAGSGTVIRVADRMGRVGIGFENNQSYIA